MGKNVAELLAQIQKAGNFDDWRDLFEAVHNWGYNSDFTYTNITDPNETTAAEYLEAYATSVYGADYDADDWREIAAVYNAEYATNGHEIETFTKTDAGSWWRFADGITVDNSDLIEALDGCMLIFGREGSKKEIAAHLYDLWQATAED